MVISTSAVYTILYTTAVPTKLHPSFSRSTSVTCCIAQYTLHTVYLCGLYGPQPHTVSASHSVSPTQCQPHTVSASHSVSLTVSTPHSVSLTQCQPHTAHVLGFNFLLNFSNLFPKKKKQESGEQWRHIYLAAKEHHWIEGYKAFQVSPPCPSGRSSIISVLLYTRRSNVARI